MSLIKIMPFVGLLIYAGSTNSETPSAAPQSAQREAMVNTRAVVEHVDQSTRAVRVRMEDGTELNFIAGPRVRNLAQLAAGDMVRVSYYESVIAQMAEPGAGGPSITSVNITRAPEGTTPGGIVRTTTDMVVEFLAYDPATGMATFKTPEGATQSVEVDPAMRDFAAARRPGERVALRITDAIAASIVEAGG